MPSPTPISCHTTSTMLSVCATPRRTDVPLDAGVVAGCNTPRRWDFLDRDRLLTAEQASSPMEGSIASAAMPRVTMMAEGSSTPKLPPDMTSMGGLQVRSGVQVSGLAEDGNGGRAAKRLVTPARAQPFVPSQNQIVRTGRLLKKEAKYPHGWKPHMAYLYHDGNLIFVLEPKQEKTGAACSDTDLSAQSTARETRILLTTNSVVHSPSKETFQISGDGDGFSESCTCQGISTQDCEQWARALEKVIYELNRETRREKKDGRAVDFPPNARHDAAGEMQCSRGRDYGAMGWIADGGGGVGGWGRGWEQIYPTDESSDESDSSSAFGDGHFRLKPRPPKRKVTDCTDPVQRQDRRDVSLRSSQQREASGMTEDTVIGAIGGGPVQSPRPRQSHTAPRMPLLEAKNDRREYSADGTDDDATFDANGVRVSRRLVQKLMASGIEREHLRVEKVSGETAGETRGGAVSMAGRLEGETESGALIASSHLLSTPRTPVSRVGSISTKSVTSGSPTFAEAVLKGKWVHVPDRKLRNGTLSPRWEGTPRSSPVQLSAAELEQVQQGIMQARSRKDTVDKDWQAPCFGFCTPNQHEWWKTEGMRYVVFILFLCTVGVLTAGVMQATRPVEQTPSES